MSNSLQHNPQQNMNDIKLQINVILWHILVAKIFAGWDFEEYYVNFYEDWKFSDENFFKCLNYMDEIFSWDNYNYRYKSFEWRSDEILGFIENDEVPRLLVESMRGDIVHIIWKSDKDFPDLLDIHPYDKDFPEDKVVIVKNWINDYIKKEINKLKKLIWSPEISQIRSELIERLKKARILS